ncbi:MAG: glutamate-cysteine ligase family protein [Planctomycetota bacterium]|jgi:glutamate--cysteine ligase|nr:glutamate-cysteine ligase family protein [Planctomycetota bacterium]
MTAYLNPAELDATIDDLLVGAPMSQGQRLLGVEVEHLILHRDTRESAPLPFCCDLMKDLVDVFEARPWFDDGVLAKMATDDFGLSMEPGGQIELDSQPKPNLAALDEIFHRVKGAIDGRLEHTPYELTALGHAPVTKVSELGLLPRPRYQIMDAEMPQRGPRTINMMRATAGFQLAFDFENREDAGRKMAMLFRLSPVLGALTTNSRMVEGEDSGHESFRQRVWWETDSERIGVPEGCLDAETAISGYVRYARKACALFANGAQGLMPSPHLPFEDLVAAGGVTAEDLELHLTTLFPFVRPRNYLELRCFDAVPWKLARSVLALVSGLVYCRAASQAAWNLSESLAIRDPDVLRKIHLDAARNGLEARTPDGLQFRDLARELIGFSTRTLGREDCDWAQVEDLEEIRARVG